MRATEPSNAVLTQVGGAAGADDWEAPDAQDQPGKWAGVPAGCWYEETRQRAISPGGGRAVHVWRTLAVSEELGVDWRVGDTVAFTTEDGAQLAATVKAVEDPHTERAEAPGEVRLTLELATS